MSLALAPDGLLGLPSRFGKAGWLPLAWGDLSLGFPADLPGRPCSWRSA
mgnify:CR=1 FL=1